MSTLHPLFRQDQAQLRRLRHAHRGTRAAVAAVPEAAAWFAPLDSAHHALRAASQAAHFETLDDAPASAARDRADAALRAGLVRALARLVAEAELAFTDERGEVTDVEGFDRLTAFVEGFAAGPRGSNLARGGPSLHEAADALAQGAARLLGATHPIPGQISALLGAARAAAEAVKVEVDELAAARAALEVARAEAARALRVARLATELLTETHPALGLSVRALFPPTPRSTGDAEADEEAALDAAGVAPVEA
jgi:hypothetical protein